MEKPPFPFHPYALKLMGLTSDRDDPVIPNDQLAHDATNPTGSRYRHCGFPCDTSRDARKVRIVPDTDVLPLTEVTQVVLAFSSALAEVTDCLHAVEADEVWDPAYRNPEIALRLAREELGAARRKVLRCHDHGALDLANAADQALADVGYALVSTIGRRDLSPDRRQVLNAWHDWRANPFRIDSHLARAASDTIHRLFYRMACYCDACLGPQVWPLEMQDPDIDPNDGDLLDPIITF